MRCALSVLVLVVGFTALSGCVSDSEALKKNLSTIEPPGSAWVTDGSPSVIVAVVDTGIDWSHPTLRPYIWVNKAEDINRNGLADLPDFNGIDDDGNGHVDDIIGWDFVSSDNDPMDVHGHGTTVSGVVQHNVASRIQGSSPSSAIKIMPIRVRKDMRTDYNRVAAGIRYAVENGARVINLSLGGPGRTPSSLNGAISEAYSDGALIVGSAGNQNSSRPQYPDALDEVISVAATNKFGKKKGYSNYGNTVEISAPSGVRTTRLFGGWTLGGGTSHSTPYVSAIGALLFHKCPNLSNNDIRQIIRETATPIDKKNPGFERKLGAGMANIDKALKSCVN